LDVHARSVVAVAIDGRTGEVVERRLTPAHDDVIRWLGGLQGPVSVAYEAGPTGFGLYRALVAAGFETVVVAPSKLIRPGGDRVKTDARDARHLASLLRVGQVTAVAVPSVEQEAARDLVRAREDCRGDLMRARHRLSKMLLRHGIVYSGGRAWTSVHENWLRTQRFESRAAQSTFDAYFEMVKLIASRRDLLDEQIGAMAATGDFATVVGRLRCLRGIDTLTAFGLAVEIGDWTRFTGRTIGAFVGLIPSEYSSGTSRVQGGVTKTGNGHARRLLVEAAWHHRQRYAVSAALMKRWDAAGDPAARARADAANRRLHHKWAGFIERKKRPVIANTAVARELAGWCWSLATLN
jgi:transposase